MVAGFLENVSQILTGILIRIPFFIEIPNFWVGQTNRAEKFWSIWGIFGRTISTHFGTVSPLSMFSIIQSLFLQKAKLLYPHPKY